MAPASPKAPKFFPGQKEKAPKVPKFTTNLLSNLTNYSYTITNLFLDQTDTKYSSDPYILKIYFRNSAIQTESDPQTYNIYKPFNLYTDNDDTITAPAPLITCNFITGIQKIFFMLSRSLNNFTNNASNGIELLRIYYYPLDDIGSMKYIETVKQFGEITNLKSGTDYKIFISLFYKLYDFNNIQENFTIIQTYYNEFLEIYTPNSVTPSSVRSILSNNDITGTIGNSASIDFTMNTILANYT